MEDRDKFVKDLICVLGSLETIPKTKLNTIAGIVGRCGSRVFAPEYASRFYEHMNAKQNGGDGEACFINAIRNLYILIDSNKNMCEKAMALRELKKMLNGFAFSCLY